MPTIITADQTELYVKDWGTGQPVILIHGGESVAKAVLVSASLPYRLKTADIPLGAEQTAFDKTAQAIKDDRPKFLAGIFENFFGFSADAQPVSPQLLEWARSLISSRLDRRTTLTPGVHMKHSPLAHGTLATVFLAATLFAGCSDTVAPTPAVQMPAASASDTSGQTTLVGTIPSAATSESPASAAADESDLTKAQESSAMPMAGQANDHSTTSPIASQKATTTP